MKNRNIFLAIIFIIIVCICFLGGTNSRYLSEVEADGNIEIAKPIIQLDTSNIREEELLIYPGITKEVPFTIKNYDGTNVNELEMDYYININTINKEFPLDDEYKIYEIINGEEIEIPKTEDKGFGPIKLKYLEQEDRNFKIVFKWTINDTNTNNSISYANKPYNFKIDIKSTEIYNIDVLSNEIHMKSNECQLLSADVQEINDGQDNTFNVTITNDNVFAVRCVISGDQGYHVVYDGTEDEKEIVIGPNTSRTIKVTFTSLDTELYTEAKRDENGKLYTLFDMWVNASKPYNGNERVISEDVKIYLKETIKNTIVANADNITEYEEGHRFEGETQAGEGDLCSIIDPVSKKIEYFYRGAVNNNYVSFAGQTWRILRINDDGSLRLILDGTIGNSQYASQSTATSIEEARQLVDWEDSIVYDTLHTWYDDNIRNNERYSPCVVESNFVFDTSGEESTSSAAGVSGVFYFTPYIRIGGDADRFQPTFSYTEDTLIRDVIGLITGDEIVYAGGYWHRTNTSFFLHSNNVNANAWTMSTSFWDMNSHHKIGVMILRPDGGLYDWTNNTIADTLAVRPVISIRGDIYMAGNGTSEDPYHYVESIGDGT